MRRVGYGLAAAVALLVVAAAFCYGALRASLPRRDGGAPLAALSAPVKIELDRRAVPRIMAESIEDAYRAQGFLHAQERFFQMDLTRRAVAGELSELMGARTLPLDRRARAFRYRARARALLGKLPARQRAWLAAYAEGVNAGLADLGSRPPEYWLLRAAPQPWTAEDSLLVAFYFCAALTSSDTLELPQGVMRATLPAPLYRFLTPSTSRFDRPLVSSGADPTAGYRPVPIPSAAVVDLRARPPVDVDRRVVDPPLLGGASNQWAVEASTSSTGEAILANDPHLRLRLPNVFYRSEIGWSGRVARGVGVPGAPGILIGATSSLAWGATVSNADQSDWVVVEVNPGDPDSYATPEGPEPFGTVEERIAVKGRADPERLRVRTTRWGPVLRHDWRGRPLALHATWLDPRGVNLAVLELPFAESVEEGAAVLDRWAGPSLNWMLVDRAGRIGWTVNGPLPRRRGFDGSVPESWARGDKAWDGYRQPPRHFGSRAGFLFTANNRTLPEADAQTLGRMWMRPFRAWRINQLLRGRHGLDERDFLAMQLDTRAAAYDRIRDVLLEVTAADDPVPAARSVREAVLNWNGRADPSEAGFRILQSYYLTLLRRALTPLLAPALEADPDFVYRWPLADEPLRRLLDERPAHLLSPGVASWQELLRATLLETLDGIQSDAERPSIDAPWGEVNRLRVGHVFADLPLLGRWLRLPDAPLPGSMVSLRVAAPSYGAVTRIVIAPSAPERGILEMPGGQSGHFMSPNFADQTADWLHGTPTPFLAGPTVHAFVLEPTPE